MKRTKKILSLLLVAALTFTLIPGISLLTEPAQAASVHMFATNCAPGVYRTSMDWYLNNVTSGNSVSWSADYELSDYSSPSPVYQKSWQTPGYLGVNAAQAVLEVDRSRYSDIRQTGIQIQAQFMAVCQGGNCRWGFELFPYSSSPTMGVLGNDWNSTTVTGSTGARYTYTLCDSNGNTMASAETAGGNFTQNAGCGAMSEAWHGWYYWYIKGAAPAVGETAVLRICAICVAQHASDNYQEMTEWYDLTIKGVCSHSQGYNNTVTAPTCTTQGYTTHVCKTCGYTYKDTYTNAKGHAWGAWTSINATQHKRTCATDASHTETANHSFTSAVTAPTCTAQGYTTHTCSVCGYSYKDTYTNANGHAWGAWTSISATQHKRTCQTDANHTETAAHSFTAAVTAPTCTEQGYTTHTCSACGYSYKDTYTNANGHDWGAWTQISDTQHKRVCRTDANHTETADHSFTVFVAETAPATCLANAKGTYKCADCEATVTKEIPNTKKDHSYTGTPMSNGAGKHSFKCVNGCGSYGGTVDCVYEDAVTAPKCTEAGFTTHTCTVCGYSYNDTQTNATGHDFSVYVEEVTPATCLTNATAVYKCKNCDETTEKEVPDSMLAHDYSGEVKSFENGFHQKKCVNGCGEYGPAVNCAYDDVVTPPTCTEGGYTTHTCTVCGYAYTDAETEALGHNFTVQQEEVTPATCLADATANFKCERCEETEVLDVPHTKLEHDYSGDVLCNEDGTHQKKCVNGCNEYGPAENCDYTDVVTPPTCTEGGYTTHTCTVCGYSYTDTETEATGHHFTEYVEEVTPATCEANATATYKCRDCDETETKEVPDTKLPHSYTGEVKSLGNGFHQKKCVNGCNEYGPAENCDYTDVVTPPTCTEGGYTTHTCTVCGYSYTDTETEATGHHFTEFVEIVSAGTCNANRVEKYKCADCDETEDREIPDSKDPENHAGGEKTESRNVTNANCVTPGSYDSVTVCLGCGCDIAVAHIDGATDPDTHTGNVRVETEDVVPGTCAAEKTWNEVTYCADCGAKLSSVPKTGEKDPAAHTGAVRTEEEDIVPATCASVKTWNEVTYCADCGEKLDSVAKTGATAPENHTGNTRVEEEDVVPGDCVSPRTWNEVTYCADCDAKLSSVPKTGATDPENHTGETRVEEEDVIPATCAAPKTWNAVTYCADCGAKLGSAAKTGETDPEAHTGNTRIAEEDVIPGTCVTPKTWNEVTYCADCGKKLGSEPKTGANDPANHKGPADVRGHVDATPDENGYSGDTYCAACNTLLKTGESLHRTKGACAYCGGYHEGVWGSVVTAVHGILWLLRQLFRFGK